MGDGNGVLTWQRNFVVGRSLGPLVQHAQRVGNTVGIDGSADTGGASLGYRTVIRRPQTLRLVDRRWQLGIVTRWDRTSQWHFVCFDNLRMCLKDWSVGVEERKGSSEYLALERRVARNTQGPSQRKLAIQRSGRRHLLGNIAHGSQHHGGQTSGFKDVGERTHGTRAQRSNRGEQDNIDLVCQELLRGRRAGVEPKFRHGVGLVASEREVTRCNIANHSRGGQFFESVDRIHHVEIQLKATVVKVWAPMTHDHVAVFTIESTEPGIGSGKSFLVGTMKRS